MSKSTTMQQQTSSRGGVQSPNDISLKGAASLDTQEFLSFEDFWQQQAADAPAEKKVQRKKSLQEVAREHAEALVASARTEAAKVMQDAHDQGFAQGKAEGLAKGKGEYQDRIAQLSSILTALNGQRSEVLHQHEEDLLQLIKTMVDRLVNHEVSVNPLVIKASLQKAMAFVVENSMVQVHIHGDDFNRVKKLSLEDPSLLEGKNRVQLVEDPNISAGGCLLKTDFGEIDATLEQSREKLFEVVDQAFMAALAGSGV